MATTTPDNIRTPSPSDPYNLVADLAILGSDVQTALNRRANAYRGTSAQRTAFTSAEDGVIWVDTNGDKLAWQRSEGAWIALRAGYQNSETRTFRSPYSAYSSGGVLTATRRGDVVHVRGAATIANPSNMTENQMISTALSSWARPLATTYAICQGSGNSRWLCFINPEGLVFGGRYDNTSQSNVWLPFDLVYVVNPVG